MPIIKSVIKDLRQSEKSRKVNRAWKVNTHKAIKKVEKIAVSKNKDEMAQTLSAAYKLIDKAAKNGIIKKNKAARVKSRLARLVAK